MPNRYQPGERKSQYDQNRKISEDRYAWVYTENQKFVVLVGKESSRSGPDVILFQPTPGRLPDVSINLTNMTSEELDAIEELITTAIAWARPVVELRDKEAEDARNAGDDTISRLYRAVPSVVYRKRPGYEHDPSLLFRPEGVSKGNGEPGGVGEEGRVRGTGDGVAEPDEGDSSTQDDGTKVDFVEVLRQVGLPIPPAPPRLHSPNSGEDDRASDS